jgi:hypothetical protein
VTVVEQVSPDSVSFVLRNLVHDEEEPGDFDDVERPALQERCLSVRAERYAERAVYYRVGLFVRVPE